MCIDLTHLWSAMASLTFAQLANVQTVGIGLYLALAVIQAVSASGISGLRRRLATLQMSVSSSKLRSEFSNMASLHADIGALEIRFHSFNRAILCFVMVLFVASVAYFAYATIWQLWTAGIVGTIFIIAFYLVVPVLTFALASIWIGIKCRTAAKEIGEAETRYLNKVLAPQ